MGKKIRSDVCTRYVGRNHRKMTKEREGKKPTLRAAGIMTTAGQLKVSSVILPFTLSASLPPPHFIFPQRHGCLIVAVISQLVFVIQLPSAIAERCSTRNKANECVVLTVLTYWFGFLFVFFYCMRRM